MGESRFLKVVRLSAWYDLLVTWPFALPWTFAPLHEHLGRIAAALQMRGSIAPLDATQVLFANLLGSVVIVWSLARILAPSVRLGRLDALARALFASWQVYAVHSGMSTVVLFFTAFEVLFGLLQASPVRANRAAQRP
ncbi:MAG: hypothetical protein LT103_09760 [Burkholderiaceae bacterium]|nr:hypothetical protein [Burkholderiaceae bacterium]